MLYNKLHGNPDIVIEYNSIDDYLSNHPDVEGTIRQAVAANLQYQGKPSEEVVEALADLSRPWIVNYIYTLLTTENPNYTIEYNVSRNDVENVIKDGKELLGGKRRRNSKNTKKYRKSRKSRKHRRTRKHRKSRK